MKHPQENSPQPNGSPAPVFPLASTMLLVGVFFMTFVSRTILSPLLLPIENELGISHAEGGSFFLIISIGLMTSMLLSGWFLQRLTHHQMITIAVFLSGAALLLLAVSEGLLLFRVALFFIGAGAGLYLPSGMTTLTDVVPSGQWGRAIALHELGPIFGLAAAPFFAELALDYADWRSLLVLLGIVSLIAGLIFARFAGGGRFNGTPPQWSELNVIIRKRQFWIIAFFFVMALGLEMGVYSMLPTYLVEARGIDQSAGNTMVSTSRLTSLLMIFIAGWLSDHIGYKKVIGGIALASGLVTAMFGFTEGWILIVAVYLQPMLISAFFPAGFTALAGVSTPEHRNLTVSLVIPLAYLFSAGMIPAVIGRLAERGAFGLGYIAVGLLMASGIVLLPKMSLPGR